MLEEYRKAINDLKKDDIIVERAIADLFALDL